MAKNSAPLTAFSSTSLLKVASLKSTHSSKDVHFWWKKTNAVIVIILKIIWCRSGYQQTYCLWFGNQLAISVCCLVPSRYSSQKRVNLQSNCSQSKAADPLCVKKGRGVYSGYNSSWLSSHQVTVSHCHIVSWHILLLKNRLKWLTFTEPAVTLNYANIYTYEITQEVLNQLPTSYLTSTEHVWVNSPSFKQIWEPWCKAATCGNMWWLIITILLKGAKPMPPSSNRVFSGSDQLRGMALIFH